MRTHTNQMPNASKIAYPYLFEKCPPELADKPKYNVTIPTGDILFIEAQVNYSVIYQHHKPAKVFSITIKNLLPRLEAKANHFIRVHKAYIINIHYVAEYTNKFIILKSGKSIPISKRRWKEVHSALSTFGFYVKAA